MPLAPGSPSGGFRLQTASFEVGQGAIAQAGGLFQVCLAFGLFDFQLRLVNFFFYIPEIGNDLFFGLPAGVELAGFLRRSARSFSSLARRSSEALSFSF